MEKNIILIGKIMEDCKIYKKGESCNKNNNCKYPNCKEGIMREKEVKKLLKENNLKWKDFLKWMIGQTVSMNENKETIYYKHDVKRYINMKINNKPTYFD